MFGSSIIVLHKKKMRWYLKIDINAPAFNLSFIPWMIQILSYREIKLWNFCLIIKHDKNAFSGPQQP